MRYTKMFTVAALLLFGAAACDLDVDNLNAPEAERALSNPGDVESLISGAWTTWWTMTYHYDGAGPMLSTASFQHSAYPANFGMVHYSMIPRVPTTNDPAHGFYSQFANMFTWGYRAISAVNDGLRALDAGSVDLADDEARARAFGKFVQGLSYGYVALMFDRGPLVDETTSLEEGVVYADYRELMDAALGYLDEAIAIANANNFTIPSSWMLQDGPVSSETLAQLAHSYQARLRAAVARTPEERAAVEWQAVLNDVNAGLQEDFEYTYDGSGFAWHPALYYSLLGGWSQLNYMVHGMADQSGQYQEWMSLPIDQRAPDLASGPFLIDTPDERFPEGATVEEQQANPGTRMIVPANPGAQWGRPDRGTWRWSYYRDVRDWVAAAYVGSSPDITTEEMRLLAAEAHYRMGDRATAADLINVTRTAAGLNATDAGGTNTDCVPRLPDGSCGDLFEMLKWEKRMDASHNAGLMIATWYFEGRGWGDLMQGTPLQWPVPALVAELDNEPINEYGGSLEWAAPVGTYGY